MFGLTITATRHLAFLEGEVERLRAYVRRVEDEKARLTDRILEVNGVRPISEPAMVEEHTNKTNWAENLAKWSEVMATETSTTHKLDEER